MTAKKSPRRPTTNYLLVGSLTGMIYLVMLWIAHYMPTEMLWPRRAVHALLALAVILLAVGLRQRREKPSPRRPAGKKRIPPPPPRPLK